MSKVNKCVVRNVSCIRGKIGGIESHNERRKDSYSNADIVSDRSQLNVHYKKCVTTYDRWLHEMIEAGEVSTRGLRPNAKMYGELIFDVNTEYFDERGGYEYAEEFFGEAYRYAMKKVGDEYIVSAVMHADEINKGILNKTGREVYHYHLHVVYVPVVKKEVKWSKDHKDRSLAGRTKEIINQISNSKKWASLPAIDENGDPKYDKNGKQMKNLSYTVLQTEFYEHMIAAGFRGFERGKQGSTVEHLSIIDYKTQESKKQLVRIEGELAEKENALGELVEQLDSVEKIEIRSDEIYRMARMNNFGNFEMTPRQFDILFQHALNGLYARLQIKDLKSQLADLQSRFDKVIGKFKKLFEETKRYRACMKIMPEAVKKLLEGIADRHKEKFDKYIAEPGPTHFPKKSILRNYNSEQCRERIR